MENNDCFNVEENVILPFPILKMAQTSFVILDIMLLEWIRIFLFLH